MTPARTGKLPEDAGKLVHVPAGEATVDVTPDAPDVDGAGATGDSPAGRREAYPHRSAVMMVGVALEQCCSHQLVHEA